MTTGNEGAATTVRATAGTQAACGGWARIDVRFEATGEPFEAISGLSEAELPRWLAGPTLDGLRHHAAALDGYRAVIVWAAVHPVDGNAKTFERAGVIAGQRFLDQLAV